MSLMQPRRPDQHTKAQRHERAADLVRMIARLNSGPIGSTRLEIFEVMLQEQRRGRRST
jgi:hypothetical protein